MKEVLNTKGVYHPDQEIKIVQKLNAKENEQYWRANNLELIQMLECINLKVVEKKKILKASPMSELEKLKKEFKMIQDLNKS